MTRASDTAKLLGAGATILDGTTISTADNTTQLTLTSTDADASSGPQLDLYRNSASPADSDVFGRIRFLGENDADEQIAYATIFSKAVDVSDGTEDANLRIDSIVGGTNSQRLEFNATEAVFNEGSADLDFRVESNGNANTLFIEGSSDNISIGHGSPTFASGKGVHLADFYFIGFGNGNGTRPDFQLGQDTSSNTLALRCGTGADTIDLSINTSGIITSPPTAGNGTSASANMVVTSGGEFAKSTSSKRYKNTINDATHGLTELLKLRSVTFKGNNDGDIVFGGLLAEEVHDAGLTEFVVYNDDDEPDALGYGNMVSLCIKAIQELKTELDNAKARITALES